MKLTKIKIEELVNEIIDFLKKHELQDSVCIYYNNKRWTIKSEYLGDGKFREEEIIEENMNPLDYFEYANNRHILSMSFEGGLYDVLNYTFGNREEQFLAIFEKYNLYYELGSCWNLTAYPTNGLEYEDIEYTAYEERTEPEYIYLHKENVQEELREIMKHWYELSSKCGDYGCCVIGAKMCFTYKGKEYEMAPCSPHQGEGSWTPHVETIKRMLRNIGATDVYYYYGRMD